MKWYCEIALQRFAPIMNIGLLLDCCGIYYTDEQLLKLEKLVENFLEKILRENKTSDLSTKSENLDVKEEPGHENLLNSENDNFMSTDICDIELKEEEGIQEEDQEFHGD